MKKNQHVSLENFIKEQSLSELFAKMNDERRLDQLHEVYYMAEDSAYREYKERLSQVFEKEHGRQPDFDELQDLSSYTWGMEETEELVQRKHLDKALSDYKENPKCIYPDDLGWSL